MKKYSVWILLIASCAHQPISLIEREVSQWLDLPSVDGETQKKAEKFDAYIRGVLNQSEASIIVAGCQKNRKENIFCASYLRLKTLNQRLQNWRSLPVFVLPKVAEPIIAHVKNGKISDWATVKKSSPKSLVKGLSGKSIVELTQIGTALKKRADCPDPLAPALAASLEDFFPLSVSAKTISDFYSKAARCARNNPYDQEHFLTRAGLLHFWQKEYEVAESFFAKATRTKDAFTSRAYYWLFQTQVILKKKEADTTRSNLLEKYPLSFHAVVARHTLGQEIGNEYLNREVPSVIRRSKRVGAINVFIEQAEVLRQSKFLKSAAFVSQWALDSYPSAETDVRLYLGWLGDAHSRVVVGNEIMGQSKRRISRPILELFFPLSHPELFTSHASGVDPYLLLSIARQESTFNEHAISIANARGLLQIHPETAAKISGTSDNNLFDPETNIKIGARYFADLLDRTGAPQYALAAYNAGEDKLQMWKEKYPVSDPVLFVDLISYRETRNYVASVLRNYFWYRRLYTNNLHPSPVLSKP